MCGILVVERGKESRKVRIKFKKDKEEIVKFERDFSFENYEFWDELFNIDLGIDYEENI